MNKIIPKNIIQHIGTFVYLLCKTTIRGRPDTLINHPASPYASIPDLPRIVSFSHVRNNHSRQSRMYSKLRSGLKAGFVKHMVDVGTYRGKADA